jgi:fatty-acyl-CoA synthase
MVNIADRIEKWAMIQPDKTALIAEGVPISYRELEGRINKVSRMFLGRGIRKGDRVAVLLRNCKQYIEVFFALSRIGAILVPLNWRLALPELEFIISDSGAEAILFEDQFLNNARKIMEKVRIHTPISCAIDGGKGPSPEMPPDVADYESSVSACSDERLDMEWSSGDTDPQILMYTSGTTGRPKGAVLSHRKTFFNLLNAGAYYDLSRKDIIIITRPLFHSGGLIIDMAPLLYWGGTGIIKRRFTPEEILKTVEQYKVTILELPATVYNFILQDCDITRYDLSSIRCYFTGGERVSPVLLKALAEKGLAVSQIYGLTETSTVFWLPTERAVDKIGSVGQPVLFGDVRILREDGTPVKPGEIGEIAVKGPILMNGYWKRSDLTRKVVKEGWLHTGDLAHADEEGFVYIVDRKKDMFISGGENVYPAEIERVLFEHPMVLDAAVVGAADEKWGEVGRAYIILKEKGSVDASAMRSFLEERLGRYKIPRYIEFVDDLPKTASGKIKKTLLKKPAKRN